MTAVIASSAADPMPLRVPSVRPATAEDTAFIEELQAIAFGPGRFARTAFRIRERFDTVDVTAMDRFRGERLP